MTVARWQVRIQTESNIQYKKEVAQEDREQETRNEKRETEATKQKLQTNLYPILTGLFIAAMASPNATDVCV